MVFQIPGSSYFEDGISDDVTDEPDPDPVKQLFIPTPSIGDFKIEVIGTGQGTYTVGIHTIDPATNQTVETKLKGVTAPGETDSFDVNYTGLAGQPISVKRTATFASTKQDIENLFKNGLIDKMGIAVSLTSKIESAEASSQRGQKIAAMNVLNAFLNELEAQKEKHINSTAYQILKEDVEFLKSGL